MVLVISLFRCSSCCNHRRSVQFLSHILYLYAPSSSLHVSNSLFLSFSAATPRFSTFHRYISSGFLFPTLSPLFSTENPLTNDNRKNYGGFFSVSYISNFDSCSKLVLQFRGFSRVSSGSDFEPDIEFGEIVDDNADGGKHDEISSPPANMDDVLRISRVVEELFSQDRSMETVLDNCGINLNHDLVIQVLNRFCRAIKPAIRFFIWAGRSHGYTHNSRTYNKMIDILGKARQFETMTVFLEEMGDKGLLTMDSFTTAVRHFSAAREKKRAVGCLDLMKRFKFKAGIDFMNYLLHNLCRAKLGKEAVVLFEKLKSRCAPDVRTYSILLNGCFMVRSLIDAVEIWNRIGEEGLKADIVAHNIMLDGLLKCGKGYNAYELIKVMKSKGPPPNVKSYTIFIRSLCKKGKMAKAVALFERMVNSGCLPDRAAYTCMITGFGNVRRMDKVCWLLMEMKKMGCPPDGRTYNALIKLMVNRRMTDDVIKVYKEMVGNGFRPTVHTFNMMMKVFFRAGDYETGCLLWEEMRIKGCCPDDNVYTVFIAGLIEHGRGGEACKYLMKMIDRGMRMPRVDFNKLAYLVGREGSISLQEDMAEMMMLYGNEEVSKMFASGGSFTKSRRNCVR